MIQCDRCSEWYHFECLDLDPDSVDETRSFFCPSCRTVPATHGQSNLPQSHAIQIATSSQLRPTDDFHSQSLPSVLMSPVSAMAVGTPTSHGHHTRPRSARKRPKQDDAFEYSLDMTIGIDDLTESADAALRNMALSPAASQASANRRRRSKANSLSVTLPERELPRRTTRARRPPSTCSHGSDDDDEDDDQPGKYPKEAGRRNFHNQRERLRRTTIRSLFDNLRKNVPAIEGNEIISDRQILIEAAQHIEELSDQDAQLEEGLLLLKIENIRLRMENAKHAADINPVNSSANPADDSLGLELAAAETRLTELQARPRLHQVRDRSASGSDTSGNSSFQNAAQSFFPMSFESPPESKPRPRSHIKQEEASLVFDSLLSVANLALKDLPS